MIKDINQTSFMDNKRWIALALLMAVANIAQSQNIGIGNTNPAARLDINGDIAIRSADITISTTYNYALDVNTVKQACYKLKSGALPIGNFIIAGIASGADGRIITLLNRTGASMEIYNNDASTVAANRVLTGTGNNLAVYNNGTVTFQYDASQSKWAVTGAHNNSLNYFSGGGGTSYWNLVGSDIKNNNPGNVGIGADPVSTYKLRVGGNIFLKGNALTGNATSVSGGALEMLTSDVTGTQEILADGKQIQAVYSSSITTLPKPSALLINPFGGNVGINYSTPLAQLFTRKTSNTASPEGSFACFGTTYGSYFHYGSNEDTYIRGGKDGSKVIINDGILGNVGIGTTNPTAKLDVNGSLRVSGGMFEPFMKIGWQDFTLDEFGLPDNYALDYNLSRVKNVIVDIPSDIGCSGYRPVNVYVPDPFPGNIYGNYLGQVLNISLSANTINTGAAGVRIVQNTNNGDVTIGNIYADLCNGSGSFRPVSFIKLICDGVLWQPIEGGFSQ